MELLTKVKVAIALVLILTIIVCFPAMFNQNTSETRYPSVTLAPGSVGYSVLRFNASAPLSYDVFAPLGYLITFSSSNSPVDFYFLNGTAFSRVLPYVGTNQSLRGLASSLESSGALEVSFDGFCGGFPRLPGNTGCNYQQVYLSRPASLSAGTYYAVYQNTDTRGSTSVHPLLEYDSSGLGTYGIPANSIQTFYIVLFAVVALGAMLRFTSFPLPRLRRGQRTSSEPASFPPPRPPDTVMVKCGFCGTEQTWHYECIRCGAPLPKPGVNRP